LAPVVESHHQVEEQLYLVAETRHLEVEQLHPVAERCHLEEEQLYRVEEQLHRVEEQLRRVEEQLRLAEEQLRQVEEQLRLAEEQFRLAEEQLRLAEEQLHLVAEQLHPVVEQLHPVAEQLHPAAEQLHPVAEQLHPVAARRLAEVRSLVMRGKMEAPQMQASRSAKASLTALYLGLRMATAVFRKQRIVKQIVFRFAQTTLSAPHSPHAQSPLPSTNHPIHPTPRARRFAHHQLPPTKRLQLRPTRWNRKFKLLRPQRQRMQWIVLTTERRAFSD
jgi:DNA repair exonuclease SbcCD ATPase subunit